MKTQGVCVCVRVYLKSSAEEKARDLCTFWGVFGLLVFGVPTSWGSYVIRADEWPLFLFFFTKPVSCVRM